MKKIVTIIGARPQFIKMPFISREIRKFAREIVVHTGQHYDANMSDIFFKELKISKPNYNLAIGSDLQGRQTGRMIEKIEAVLIKEKPDLVLIYGDTNSTVAGALAASKLDIPVAHVEAGLRSYNRKMPEEINRVIADHISSLLFTPTRLATEAIKKEGITKGVYFVGDVMCDIQLKIKDQSPKIKDNILKTLNLEPKTYLLATVHRQENTNDKKNLENIFKAFEKIKEPIIYPLHPRTKKFIKIYGWEKWVAGISHLRLIEPVGYKEMITLETCAKMILTDSGGVQKEAYLAYVPCIVLRRETEWEEINHSGWSQLAGADTQKIVKLVHNFPQPTSHPNFLGNGKAYLRIAKIIKNYLLENTEPGDIEKTH